MATGDALPDSSQQSPQIRPLPYDVTVTPRPGASAELAEVGRRYWAFAGIDELGRIVWSEKTNAINAGSRPYVAAAAGVIAEVADVSCTGCGLTPWQPRSRTALDDLARDRQQAGCVSCDESLQLAMTQEADPTGAAYRRAVNDRQRIQAETARERAAVSAARAHARIEWDRRRRAAAHAAYPEVLTDDPSWEAVRSSVAVEAATLACLRFAPSSSPIPPINDWLTPLTPDEEWTRELVAGWWHDRLLRVDPDSDLSSFAWEVDFQQAFDACPDKSSREAVLATLPLPITNKAIYATSVRWYSPYGPTMGTAAERLDEHLAIRLSPARMSAARQAELLDLLVKLIAAETLRYFDFLIDEHNLPSVPDNHRPRLVLAAQRVAAHRPLGEIYNLVWQAARAAAAAAQAHPRAPEAHMTTHAVNQFEQKAQQAVANPEWQLKRWREISRLPLSALTSLLFRQLLHADPMDTARDTAAGLLPVPRPDPAEEEPDYAADDLGFAGEEANYLEPETGDSADLVIVEAIRAMTEIPEDRDASLVLLAFWVSRLDFVPYEDDESSASPDEHDDARKAETGAVHTLLHEGIEAMCRVGRSVELATGDARMGLIAACAAGASFPFAVGDDAGNKTTVGRFLAERLVSFASREWKQPLWPDKYNGA